MVRLYKPPAQFCSLFQLIGCHDAPVPEVHSHSERVQGFKRLRHFDGAVKVYSEDQYEARLSSQMPHETKSIKKIKLFRIDGDVDVDKWIELTSYFFKSNEMVIQYFDPTGYERAFAENIKRYREIQGAKNL